MTDVADIAKSLTKAQRDDLDRAICTAGKWWVPCASSGHPLIHNGDLTPRGEAVRAHLQGNSHD